MKNRTDTPLIMDIRPMLDKDYTDYNPFGIAPSLEEIAIHRLEDED